MAATGSQMAAAAAGARARSGSHRLRSDGCCDRPLAKKRGRILPAQASCGCFTPPHFNSLPVETPATTRCFAAHAPGARRVTGRDRVHARTPGVSSTPRARAAPAAPCCSRASWRGTRGSRSRRPCRCQTSRSSSAPPAGRRQRPHRIRPRGRASADARRAPPRPESKGSAADLDLVVGHAQRGERGADLVRGQRPAAVGVKVRKRRRKILLLHAPCQAALLACGARGHGLRSAARAGAGRAATLSDLRLPAVRAGRLHG